MAGVRHGYPGGAMTERCVRQTGKDAQGDLTALRDVGEAWSSRLKAAVVHDIEGGIRRYYVARVRSPPTPLTPDGLDTGK